MLSIIIPVHNESLELLTLVISNMNEGISPDDCEIVLVNDGSIYSDGTHQRLAKDLDHLKTGRNIKFIDRKEQFGVGYSFDEGAKQAIGDILVLCGSDVFPPKRSWLKDVQNTVKSNEIGCACSVGLQPGNYDINAEGLYLRYGAKILWTLTVDDLPKNSPLRKYPNYREIIGCKWANKISDEPYEIDACYGAFYFIKKEFYQRMGGFDTIERNHLHGFAYWGHLEAMLSLKVRVYGGKCVMYPDIKVGHIFGRLDDKNVASHRAVREDYHFWNRLWIAHTLLDDELRDECLNHLLPCLNLNQAKVWIRQNWDAVQRVRERNKREEKLIKK